MKKSLLILTVLFVTTALLSAEDSVLDDVKKKYKPENWPGKNNPLKAGCKLGDMKSEGFDGSKVENLPPQPARCRLWVRSIAPPAASRVNRARAAHASWLPGWRRRALRRFLIHPKDGNRAPCPRQTSVPIRAALPATTPGSGRL